MSKILTRILEVDISDKIARDPQRSKMLSIAWKHDKHLPHDIVARLGPKPDERAIAKAWSDMLEKTLERTNYGDLSRDFKFADWLTRLFTTGAADWEDISGEGGDALGAQTEGLLKGLGMGLWGLAWFAIPLAALWMVLGIWLGTTPKNRAR